MFGRLSIQDSSQKRAARRFPPSSLILWSASEEVTTAVFHILPASSFTYLPFDALLYEVLAA